jgi:hypothetical protein
MRLAKKRSDAARYFRTERAKCSTAKVRFNFRLKKKK